MDFLICQIVDPKLNKTAPSIIKTVQLLMSTVRTTAMESAIAARLAITVLRYIFERIEFDIIAGILSEDFQSEKL